MSDEAPFYTSKVTDGKGKTVSVEQANAFVKRLEAGDKPIDAARTVGADLRSLRRSPEVIARIKDLQHFAFTDEQINWLITATMTQDLLTSENPRDRQGAAKVLAMKPEVGFTAGDTKIEIVLSEEVKNLEPTPLEWAKGDDE